MSESYLGEIRMFAGNFAPQGWAFCDGSLLSISGNDALFTLLGTTYGGDGENTFALPDLRGRTPLHTGVNPTTQTYYALNQKAGVETVILTSDQLPVHTHVPLANATAADSAVPTNNVWALNSVGKPYVTTAPNGTMNPALISSAGGNQAHDNMMPSLTVSFIISLYGIYPSQN